MKLPNRIIITGLITTILACSVVTLAHATSAIPNSGITVAPAVIKATVAKNDTEQVVAIGVRNNYKVTISIDVQLKSVDQDQAILTPANDLDAKLGEALSISPSSFTLQPGQSINVQLYIKNSPALKPGGNYAAVVIKQSEISGKAIGLQSAISVSVFIDKQEGAVHQLLAPKVSVNRLFFGKPISITVTFVNNGNVAEVPRGIATVSNASISKIYQKGVINEGSLEVYPTKQLTLETKMSKIIYDWLPGRRVVSLQYRSDSNSQPVFNNVKIWYMPNGLVFGFAILACFAALAYNKREAIRGFDLKEVKKSYQQSAKPKTRKISVTIEENEAYKIPFHRS